MTEDNEETQSDRVQSVFTNILKSIVNDLCMRYVEGSYDHGEVMFDSAMVMIKESAQIAVIMGVDKDTYLGTCGEVYDVIHLMMSEVSGTA